MTAAFNWMAHHPWPTLWLILPLCVAVEGWLTYDEAEALIAGLLGEPADDEPELMDADDRAASRADDEYQRRMEG